MGVQHCICLNPKENLKTEVQYESSTESKKEPNNFQQVKFNKNESKKELIQETVRSGMKLSDSHNKNKSNNTNNNSHIEFDDRLKPGLEVAEGQMPPKLSEKLLEVEESIGKFILTDKEKEYIGNTNKNLKKYTLLYSDNKIYDGQFNSSWEKDGYGFLYSTDGSKFEGIFQKDKMYRGRLINVEGDYYEGINLN